MLLFLNSLDYAIKGKRQERVISLLKQVNANMYISGPAGKSYIDPISFQQEGIELIWKDYSRYPKYQQLSPSFEHAVSVLDLLFNTGPEAPYYIWGWRDEMRNENIHAGQSHNI